MTALLQASKSPPESGRLLPGHERLCARLVLGIVVITLLVGVSNLVVWLVPSLRPFASWPGVMVMRCNSSLALVTASLSLLMWLWAEGRSWLRGVAIALAIVPLIIGGFTSLEYVLPIHSRFDEWLAPGTFVGDRANAAVVSPGRMSLNASLSFFLLGWALAALDWEIDRSRGRTSHPASLLAVLSALPPCLGLVGYLLGQGGFTGLLKSTNILFHVAGSLVLLAVGLLAVRPLRQPMTGLFSSGAEGVLLRWLLPGSSVLLLALAWLIGKGRTAGFVEAGEGTALMLFGGLVLLFMLIVSASRAVRQQEASADHALAALRERERLSQSILNTSLDGVVLINPSGEVVRWNSAAGRLFGWTEQEQTGIVLASSVIPEWAEAGAHGQLERDPLAAGDDLLGTRLELRGLRRDGSEFPVEFNLNALQGMGSAMFVGFVRDITERKAAEDALREAKERAEKASQAKDDFLAALSHELRTPLTPVLLSASSLRDDLNLPEDARKELAMIERNVTLEARLIDDLLDLTRIAKGKLQLRSELCDIHDLLGHAVEIIQDEARSRSLSLNLHLAALRQGIQGDPARLQQVFWNLLKNAVKFTPIGGSITVRSWDASDGNALVVELSDTGIGFPAGLGDRLFLPFEQGERGGDHQFGGLGLGLAITRAIVDLHHGSIEAQSAGPNQGATFIVRLPNAQKLDTDRPNPRVEAPRPSERAPALKLLLVEDHEPTRNVLTLLLSRAGHDVKAAGSLTEALKTAEGGRFDAVVSDLGLPDGTGLELLPQLLAMHPNLKGIALSGYGMEEDLQRSTAAGFSAHLVKPVKFAQLAQVLRQVLPATNTGETDRAND